MVIDKSGLSMENLKMGILNGQSAFLQQIRSLCLVLGKVQLETIVKIETVIQIILKMNEELGEGSRQNEEERKED